MATSGFYHQQLYITGDGATKNSRGKGDSVSPEVESLYSDGIDQIRLKNNIENTEKINENDSTTRENNSTSELDQSTGIAAGNDVEDLSNGFSGMNVSVSFNVTDESGVVNDVEIYDPEKRGKASGALLC
jgi:hypothetical protein